MKKAIVLSLAIIMVISAVAIADSISSFSAFRPNIWAGPSYIGLPSPDVGLSSAVDVLSTGTGIWTSSGWYLGSPHGVYLFTNSEYLSDYLDFDMVVAVCSPIGIDGYLELLGLNELQFVLLSERAHFNLISLRGEYNNFISDEFVSAPVSVYGGNLLIR